MTKMGRAFLCGMVEMLAAASSAADIGGQWRAEFDTQIGLQKYVFTFQPDGSKVTGNAVSEVNGQKRETELQEGMLTDDSLRFVEMFSFQGNEIRIKYPGKVGADEIAFTREGRGGFGGPIVLGPDDKPGLRQGAIQGDARCIGESSGGRNEQCFGRGAARSR